MTITYNAIGNIMSKSDIGTYTYASLKANGTARPHAVSQIIMNDGTTVYGSYTYDANGNQTSGAGRTLAWNSWNMPSQITGTGKNTPTGTTSSTFQFVYNASHERVKEILPDGTEVRNMSPRVDTGIHIEVRIKNGVTTLMSSLYAGNMPFGAARTAISATGVKTDTTAYYHTDHLGSIIAITNDAGTVVERRSYDAWGKRRNSNGTAMNNAFVTPDVRHAFTGHEDLGEIGLIHMNGRLYDPAIGRFISADPTIQYPDDMQNYNRYSYINNNPLSAVDHSGYGWNPFKAVKNIVKGIGKAISGVLKNSVVRTIASIAIAVYAPEFIGSTNLFGGALYDYANVIAGGLSGLVSGRGDLKAAVQGAISAGVMGGIGDAFTDPFANTFAHAVAGCGLSAASGGSCKSGALSGGFSAAAANSGFIQSSWGPVGGAMASAVIGGTASVLGGGKFENGATTAAFGYLFNHWIHVYGEMRDVKIGEKINPFGHSASGVTGEGLYSYGNEFAHQDEVDAFDYIAAQSTSRDQLVTIVPTTSRQDTAALQFYSNHLPSQSSVGLLTTCATMSSGALSSMGLESRFYGTNFPGAVYRHTSSLLGAKTWFIPKNSLIPPDLIKSLKKW